MLAKHSLSWEPGMPLQSLAIAEPPQETEGGGELHSQVGLCCIQPCLAHTRPATVRLAALPWLMIESTLLILLSQLLYCLNLLHRGAIIIHMSLEVQVAAVVAPSLFLLAAQPLRHRQHAPQGWQHPREEVSSPSSQLCKDIAATHGKGTISAKILAQLRIARPASQFMSASLQQTALS